MGRYGHSLNPEFQRIVGLKDNGLAKYVRDRVYETDESYAVDSRKGGMHPMYVEVLIAALNFSKKQGGDMSFPERTTRIVASLIGDIEEKETGKIERPDLVAAMNLSLVVPLLPKDYARGQVMFGLESLSRRWVEAFKEPLSKEATWTTNSLLDSLNSLRKPGDPNEFHLELWRDPINRPYWSVAFVGVAISSLVDTVRILPECIERSRSANWNNANAIWAFYSLHGMNSPGERRNVANRLADLSRGVYGEPPDDFPGFLTGLEDSLRKVTVPEAHIQEIKDGII